jgi:hypothetical protein
MNRPLLLLIGAAVVTGSPGCARMDGTFSPSPAPTASPGTAAAASPGPQAALDRAALVEACRRDADRVVLYRDRGQLMREDERDARIGTDSSIYARRIETDRLGRVFERDRLAAECHQQQDTRPRTFRR